MRRGRDVGRRRWAILCGIAALGFVVRALPVWMGAGLGGLHGYDDGVYLGAAIALSEGLLPYRDVMLLHPPGQVLALVPMAWLGAAAGDDVGYAVAALLTLLLGAVNTLLVGVVAGRRWALAGILAALVYAVWNASANAERTTDLHALQNTFLLLGLLVMSRPGRIRPGRAALAGAFLGLSTGVQLWQGVSTLVLLWWVVVRAPAGGSPLRRLRSATAYALGAGGAFAALTLPFFIAAPAAMVRFMLVDQVGRAPMLIPVVERLRALEGLPRTIQLPAAMRGLVPDPAVVLIAAAGVALIVVTAWRIRWARPWGVLAFAQAAVVLVAPSFFNDYAAFVTPAGSLVLGTGLAMCCRTWVRAGHRLAPALVVVGVLLAVAAVPSVAHPEGEPLDVAALRATSDGARCVSADYPTLLIVTGALRRDAREGCPVVVDPTGVRHDSDRDLPPGLQTTSMRAADGYQAAMIAWYCGAEAALFVRHDNGFTDETRAAIEACLPGVSEEGIVTVRTRAP